jgi:hypothetical protein
LVTETAWAAGDSSDDEEMQQLRSKPKVLFPWAPRVRTVKNNNEDEYDSDNIFL